jgi:hypothetical protein
MLMMSATLSACADEAAQQPRPQRSADDTREEQAVSLSRAEIVEFCRAAQLRHPNDVNAQLLLINQFAASTSEPRRVAELCTTYAQGAADAAQELAQDIERQRAKAK